VKDAGRACQTLNADRLLATAVLDLTTGHWPLATFFPRLTAYNGLEASNVPVGLALLATAVAIAKFWKIQKTVSVEKTTTTTYNDGTTQTTTTTKSEITTTAAAPFKSRGDNEL